MRLRPRPALVVGLLLNFSSAIHAQDHRAYAGGGFMESMWGGRESPESSPSLTFARSTGAIVPGFFVEGGVALGPVLSVGGELCVPSRHEWTQGSDYVFGPFRRRIRYRDGTIAAVARLQTPAAKAVRAAFVGGFAFVHQSSIQRSDEGRLGPNGTIEYSRFGAEQKLAVWTGAAVLGGDVVMLATNRVSVVPQIRLSLIARDGIFTDIGSLNVARVVFRAGVGVRVQF
jgi:hypothetical protein